MDSVIFFSLLILGEKQNSYRVLSKKKLSKDEGKKVKKKVK